jgi:integrase
LLAHAGLIRKGDNLHFRALRHFAASCMIENGWPLMDVASLLGHSKFDMTLRVYAHPIVGGGNQRSEAMERMAAKLLTYDCSQASQSYSGLSQDAYVSR